MSYQNFVPQESYPVRHYGDYTITPTVAKTILEKHNIGNRPIQSREVMKLTRLIETNKFMHNGEPIIFDLTGNIISGQHRLKACVTAQKAITSAVLVGVPKEMRTTIDRGQRRSAGQDFSMRGVTAGNTKAAAAKSILMLAHHDPRSAISDIEIEEYLEKFPLLGVWSERCEKVHGPRGFIAAVLFIYEHMYPELGEQLMAFYEAYRQKVPSALGQGCPAHMLALRQLERGKYHGMHAMKQDASRKLVLSAVSKFVQDQTVKQLKPVPFMIAGWTEECLK